MNIYHTETEQIEVIKQWFRKYGHWIFSIVFIILLSVTGYHLWERHVQKVNSQASERYQQLMVYVANDDNDMINAQANDLRKHFSKTIYAQSATLAQAKLLISQKKWDQALTKLNDVITHGNNAALRQIARLRSARILCMLGTQNQNAQKNYQAALSLLKTVDDPAYLPAINEIKGDIYLGLQNKKQAHIFYAKAMKGFSKINLNSPFLEMKFNQINDSN